MFLRKLLSSRRSLLLRLALLYALALTFLSSLSFLILYYRLFSITMARMDEELLEKAERFSPLLIKEGLKSVRTAIFQEAESENPREEFERILNFKGDVLVATNMSSWGSVSLAEPLAKLRNDGLSHVADTIVIPRHDYKARIMSVVIGPDTVIQVGETLKDLDEYLEVFRTLFFTLTAMLIILSAVVGWFLARRALIDMEEVTRTAEDISRGSYDRRVKVEGRFKEIEKLGATFNGMLDCIQTLLKSMKEITDNVAHDLRSPLARIRGIAEMSLLGDKSIDDYRDMAVNTIEECDTLIDMINTMLDITEAEAGVKEIKREEVDLVSLISEACDLFRPIAEEKRIDLKTILPEVLNWKSDKKKLQRIVSNMLENAIKYTPETGTVTVSALGRNGEIRIDIQDTGMGISETDLPHIFDRFYRCDRSRSNGGVGLGLSLVKAYTESLNGTIHVKSTPNHGSIFSLRFPH
jgi:signal transduction histidine kinase